MYFGDRRIDVIGILELTWNMVVDRLSLTDFHIFMTL